MSLQPKTIDNFDEAWNSQCQEAVINLFDPVACPKAILLYNTLYHLSIARPYPFIAEIYKQLSHVCLNSAHQHLSSLSILTGIDLAKAYLAAWTPYHIGVLRIHHLCSYLNRLIAKTTSPEPIPIIVNGQQVRVKVISIKQMAWYIWKVVIFDYFRQHDDIFILSILMLYFSKQTRTEPSAELVNAKDLKTIIESIFDCCHEEGPILDSNSNLINLQLYYQEGFEASLLAQTKDYYKQQSSLLIEKLTGEQYIQYVESQLNFETTLAHSILPLQSIAKIIRAIEIELVVNQQPTIQRNFQTLLLNDSKADISILYNLMRRIPDGTGTLTKSFEEFLVQRGTGTTKNAESIELMVSNIGQLYGDAVIYMDKVFYQDRLFEEPIRNAIRKTINEVSSGSRITERLACYIDKLLIDGSKNQKYPQASVNDAIIVLRHLPDREVFQRVFLHLTAIRLLSGTSGSSLTILDFAEHQYAIIDDLSVICDRDFINKLIKMYADMRISYEMKNTFVQWQKKEKNILAFEMNPSILNVISWPFTMEVVTKAKPTSEFNHEVNSGSNLKLEPEFNLESSAAKVNPQSSLELNHLLQQAVGTFESFYQQAYSGRKLLWRHDLSRVTLAMYLGSRTYELNVTFPQAQLLWTLGQKHGGKMIVSSLCALLQMEVRQVSSLVKPLLLIELVKLENLPDSIEQSEANPVSYFDFRESTVLSFNNHFHHSKTRLKMTPSRTNLSDLEEVEVGSKTNNLSNELEEDCKFYLQALITRLLKGAKELSSARLYQLVIEACSHEGRFLPNPSQIRNAIDYLLERQYIEHDQKMDLFLYIA